jgi:hypothetical protein
MQAGSSVIKMRIGAVDAAHVADNELLDALMAWSTCEMI